MLRRELKRPGLAVLVGVVRCHDLVGCGRSRILRGWVTSSSRGMGLGFCVVGSQVFREVQVTNFAIRFWKKLALAAEF